MITNNTQLIDAIKASRPDLKKIVIAQVMLEFIRVVEGELFGQAESVWIGMGTLRKEGLARLDENIAVNEDDPITQRILGKERSKGYEPKP